MILYVKNLVICYFTILSPISDFHRGHYGSVSNIFACKDQSYYFSSSVVCLFVRLSVCPSVRLFVRPSICLSVRHRSQI